MTDRLRVPLLIVVGVALAALVSQLLPSSNPDRWSPVAVLLLAVAGAVAGWLVPSLRGWTGTVLWVVAAAALVLLSWTDLLLDVPRSIEPVDAWQASTFVAIVAAVGLVSAGFALGAVARRRGSIPAVRRALVIPVVVVVAICILAAGTTAVAFSRSPLVLQPDEPQMVVRVSDDGLSSTASVIDGDGPWVVYESAASGPLVIAKVEPLALDTGLPRALASGEIESWLAGDWELLGPQFHYAVTETLIRPGERVSGGSLRLEPSPDGSGGVLWYVASVGASRPWPGDAFDDEVPVAPWPADHHLVVPLAAD